MLQVEYCDINATTWWSTSFKSTVGLWDKRNAELFLKEQTLLPRDPTPCGTSVLTAYEHCFGGLQKVYMNHQQTLCARVCGED